MAVCAPPTPTNYIGAAARKPRRPALAGTDESGAARFASCGRTARPTGGSMDLDGASRNLTVAALLTLSGGYLDA